jgi:hypothetical protein
LIFHVPPPSSHPSREGKSPLPEERVRSKIPPKAGVRGMVWHRLKIDPISGKNL